MRDAAHWSELGYAMAIRLYPPAFRAEFGDEMQAVFAEAMAEAGGAGATGIAALWLRELRDLPISLLRAHWCVHRGRLRKESPPSPPRPASFARWGAMGFGIGFALVGSTPRILASASQLNCGLALLLRMILYLSAGALSGALLGMASRSRRTILSFALAGSLAFGLALRATDCMVMLSSPLVRVLAMLLITQPMLIGALVGGLAGAAQKRWKHAARSAFIGALMFGLGRMAGSVLALAPWGIAQAVASYQAPPANAWFAAVPSLVMTFACVVTGIIGGAYLGLTIGRRHIVANR